MLRVLTGGAAERERDSELVRAFLVGDEEAFEELWRRHEPTLLSVVRRYARVPEDARDLVQRAFLRALSASRRGVAARGAKTFPFKAWVLRIAVNLAKNHARDEARWRREPLEAVAAVEASSPSADEALLRRERERLVRKAVLELPRRQREVLTLRLDADLSFEEVAEVLGITRNNAKVCFHHAVRRLRELVGDRASAAADAPEGETP
ncbi:MAG TPA: sigma-70 family RNA polymerase sigma factor [Anaeromyxobacteraceae bacterium]|nr:sigma-70 family RNA polymerase sigma factor [Anaeromyxobacteraceae bacterium]